MGVRVIHNAVKRGLGLAVITVLALLAPASAQTGVVSPAGARPLTEQQINGLVQGQVDNQRLAVLVAERGIGFTPTQQFLDTLRKEGADDVLIQAIRDAKPAVAPASSAAPENPIISAAGIAVTPAVPSPSLPASPLAPLACPPAVASLTTPPEAPSMAEIQKTVQQDIARADAAAGRQAWADAETSYRQAIKLDPGIVAAHLGLGNALGVAERWDEAAAEYREVLRLDPANERAQQRLGEALAEKHDWDGAIEAYRTTAAERPNDADLESKLGDALYAKGSLTEAAKTYQAAAALTPEDAKIESRLGAVLYASGDLAGAVRAYREAIKLGSDDAATHSSLGDALLAQGDRRDALEEYHRAFELAPNNSTVDAAYPAILKKLGSASPATPGKP